jgi:RHS repeat-associated protein
MYISIRIHRVKKICLLIILLFVFGIGVSAQTDTRYDSDMNLPFNQKAGNVNPQTGNVSVSGTDVSLPGRAGMNFSFGRMWNLNQSSVYNMFFDSVTGLDTLDNETISKLNNLGIGWSSTLPVIQETFPQNQRVLTLFLGGAAFEIDQSGIAIDNPDKSNLLGYDLVDKRIFTSTDISYDEFVSPIDPLYTLPELKASYSSRTYANGNSASIADRDIDRSGYQLLFTNNSKLYFRPDGKVMMQEDPSGINRIWYLYDAEGNLAVVVDSIGREILFDYDSYGNISEISWDVLRWEEGGVNGRQQVTTTMRVRYEYETTASYLLIQSVKDAHVGLDEMTVLKRVIRTYSKAGVSDPEELVTEFSYEEKTAAFSFNSSAGQSLNAHLLLTDVYNMYVSDTEYLSGQHFEYETPVGKTWTKYFFNGFREYFKVSRQFVTNRHQEEMNDTKYHYYENGENGNRNKYTSVIEVGNTKTTYTYSDESNIAKRHTLSSVETETVDGFNQRVESVYDNRRTKSLDVTLRSGVKIYEERYYYNEKGQLTTAIDKMGTETRQQYDPKFGIPIQSEVLFTDRYGDQHYITFKKINELGQVVEERMLHSDYGAEGLLLAKYEYDEVYGNLERAIDAKENTVYTLYDTTYHAFPVEVRQDVTISDWSQAGGVHANWMLDPNGIVTEPIRSRQVFNSDGSVYLAVDNDGYSVESFYDPFGTPIKTVSPDVDDETDLFVNSELSTLDLNGAAFLNYLSSRANNPSARMYVDYATSFVRTEADMDVVSGAVVVSGVQKDGLGNVEREIRYRKTGPDGYEEYAASEMVYDSLGRMIALHDADRGSSFSTMTIHGKAVSRFDKTWLVKYDDLGRTVAVLYPETDPGRTDIKRMYYDDVKNTVTTIDPVGREAFQKMDWNGNILEVRGYGNADTPTNQYQTYLYEYDGIGRRTAFTDAMGLVTTYRYDERSLLVEQGYGNGSDRMVYNELGQLIEKRDRKGIVLTFSYDELGRNTAVNHFENEDAYLAGSAVRTVQTEYDRRGNAVRVHSSELIEHYLYDHSGRVVSLDRRFTDQALRTALSTVWGGMEADQLFSFQYNYNDGGMLTQMTYPDGSVHEYAYDDQLGQLEMISEGSDSLSVAPFVTDLDYNLSGVVTRMDYANGGSQTWAFDNRKRISEINIVGSLGLIEQMKYVLNGSGDVLSINQHEYEYDGFNRIIGAKTLLPESQDYIALVSQHFGTYDGGLPVEGRSYESAADLSNEGTSLARIDGADLAEAVARMESADFDVEEFTYDKNGNRLTLLQNGDLYSYRYGERNRLVSVSLLKAGETQEELFAEYEYDENGNTIKRTIHGSESVQEIEFTYDTMNRLIATEESTTSITGTVVKSSEYRYDNAGNRFLKIDGDGNTTVYLRHGQIAVAMDIVVEADQTEELGEINRYVLSGDLLAGRVTTTITTTDTTEERFFYHLDHLNSTKLVTDESGEVVVNYIYRAFGEQLRRMDKDGAETEDEAKYSYGGKELDDNTNLYYFNARYYDATIGRFINVDPIQDGTNWYVYVSNNPLNMVDPTGLSPFDSLTEEQLFQYFAKVYGNPYESSVPRLNSTNSPPFFPSKVIKSDYPLYARIISGLLPSGVDDSYGAAALQSIADAIQGGGYQRKLTIYTDRGRNAITGWRLEVFLPVGDGAAENQSDWEWTELSKRASLLWLKNDEALMAKALSKLNRRARERILAENEVIDVISGAAPIYSIEEDRSIESDKSQYEDTISMDEQRLTQ